MRTFVAVEIPAGVRQAMAAEQERLRCSLRPVRWVRRESMHLTLVFLGEVADDLLPGLAAAARAACGRIRPGSFRVAGRGCFPARGKVRVLWVGVQEDEAGTLTRLQGCLVERARAQGLRVERRPFSPHLTLGRARTPLPRAAVEAALAAEPSLDLGEVEIRRCVLFRSRLDPGGARYEPLFPIDLGT